MYLLLMFVGFWIEQDCGDCSVIHSTPGCSIADVSDCVCELDSFCCISAWNNVCVIEVTEFGCNSFCTVPTPSPISQISSTLSSGWIFTMIVLIIMFTYCFCGIIYKMSVMNSSGIPHQKFWRNLIDLVADGIIFVTNKCLKSHHNLETNVNPLSQENTYNSCDN